MTYLNHTIPHVPDSESVSALSTRVQNAVTAFLTAASTADGHWQELSEVFLVSGAESAPEMLMPLVRSGMQFSMTAVTPMIRAIATAEREFETLKTKRDRLVEQMATINSAYDRTLDNRNMMFRRFDSAQSADPDSAATYQAEVNLYSARQDFDDVIMAADYFTTHDLPNFVTELEDAERRLGTQLAGAAGTGRVIGPNGDEVSTMQYHWGVYVAAYPGAPSGTPRTLASNLELELGAAAASKIRELAHSSEFEIRDWLSAHPDFMSSVTFIPPETAQRLYENLAQESVNGPFATWSQGPLLTLLAAGPGLIGNLNGIPAAEKHRYNSAYLQQLIASPHMDAETVARLKDLLAVLQHHDGSSLQSVFLDSDGKPRASLGFGDLDNATQINTLTHGIEAGLDKEGNIAEWSNVAQNLLDDLESQNTYTGTEGSPAMLLFFEWDSGDKHNVWGIERPNAGAERLNALVGGYEFRNPDIQQNMIVHSLGTTNGGQAAVAQPKLWDNVYFVGSAGITELTAEKLKDLSGGDLNVFATHAGNDFVAPLGRNDWFFNSEHPVDPRDIPGVETFGSDGGHVPDFLSDEGAQGGAVEGHNSAKSEDWLYRIFRGTPHMTPTGETYFTYPDDARGYLDQDAESYMHLIVELSKTEAQ